MRVKRLLLAVLMLSAVTMYGADSIAVQNIDEVIVHSYRSNLVLKDAPNKVEIISLQNIEHSSAYNLGDLIKRVSSVEAVDLGGMTGGFEFRGFAPIAMGMNRYSSMLLDGLPIGTSNASAISIANLGSVEILKGPFSALYGSNAMGGVVNLISRETIGTMKSKLSLGYGSYGSINASFFIGSSISKMLDMDLVIDAKDQKNDYKTGKNNLLGLDCYDQIVLGDTKNRIVPKSSHSYANGSMRVGVNINKNWRLNIYNSLFEAPKASSNGTIWGVYDQITKEITRNLHRIDLTTKQGNHSFRFSPYFSCEKSYSQYASPYGESSEKNNFKTYGFMLQDIINLRYGTLTLGVDNYSQKNNSTRFDFDDTQLNPWKPDYVDMQTGAFAQLHQSFIDSKLSTLLGLRYDNSLLHTKATPLLTDNGKSKKYDSFNPSLAAKYNIFDGLYTHTSIGRGFLVPNAFQTVGEYEIFETTYIGNPGLKPESSTTYDIGVEYRSRTNDLHADVTYFITNHKNLIGQRKQEDESWTFINAEKAKMQGIELLGSWDMARLIGLKSSLRLHANYTHLFSAKVWKDGVKSDREYVARNNASFGVDYTEKRFNLSLWGRWIGSKINANFIDYDYQSFRPELVGESLITLPDFMVFDLSTEFRITKMCYIGAKCSNIFDELYMERDGYYAPGRMASANITFRF